jgi:hypothetical protein
LQLFGSVAVPTGTQVAQLQLSDDRQVDERLVLGNVFRHANGCVLTELPVSSSGAGLGHC